ncbi:MAG TPA: branched-chain amino acid ABC transporter permease [Candidatus Micrarchaeaceae archaeon]|nr:branched-chain amino acid ABC transporter permease [Candidatus Micrarchaeaceae archaeon]
MKTQREETGTAPEQSWWIGSRSFSQSRARALLPWLGGLGLIGLAAALLGFGITTNTCPASGSIWIRFISSGLTLGFMYAMIALGYSMVYGILQLLNFAHSEVFMIGSFAGLYTLTGAFGINGHAYPSGVNGSLLVGSIGAALLVGAIASGLAAVAIERIAYRPLRRRGVSRLGYLITAIGMSLFLQNLFLLLDGQPHLGLPFNWPRIAGRNAVPYPDTLHLMPAFRIMGVPINNTQILVVVVAIVMLVVLDVIVLRTHTGQQIRAVAEDPEAASLLGVNIDRVIVITFFLGGVMAGIAGGLYGIYYGQAQWNMGFVPGIKAFTAAVLGGIGNVRGAMLGGVLLGLIENLGVACTGVEWQGVIAFAILILVLMFRPTGLLGEQVSR